ncbi:MAG: HAD family hydrolase [Gammaproteobacteria bacterium]
MQTVLSPQIQKDKTQIRATDFNQVLDQYADKIKTLSLDCFDTLLWRKTATPKDIFYLMQQRPLFQALNVTAYQRIKAAARAYRAKFIANGTHEIKLSDIYHNFTSLSKEQQTQLLEEELLTEMDSSFAFAPVVELIRQAHSRGIKVIIVSDTYFDQHQLRRLLSHSLPNDVMSAIDLIFCSCEYNKSKKEGLFESVLLKLSDPADSILHIGDHPQADYDAPQEIGAHALHFLQFDPKTVELLRLQHSFAPIATLANPTVQYSRPARYNPFRSVLSFANLSDAKPETSIGYATFGPLLYAFAQFLSEEIDEMQQAGKKPKVFFLLRDAYLLEKSCEAYAGKSLGKLVRIRKFVTVAASFRTRSDVDNYISGIEPEHFNFAVIAEQLLLPQSIAAEIIRLSIASNQPLNMFNELIHNEDVLKLIFEQSAAYRQRLIKYIKKEMQLEKGDTVVLVDTGYIGVTQHFLTLCLKDEIDVEIVGRYFISSHEPDRPLCKALITSSLCDHGLFEQSGTFKEGCVLDYDNDGNPIFDKIKLTDQQYDKVNAIQAECLRFIHDAKNFFAKSNLSFPTAVLQETAIAALRRHIYLPTRAEVIYFHTFQHDKDMGPTGQKTMYNLNDGYSALRKNNTSAQIHPYEARAASLELTLSTMISRIFNPEFLPEDINLRQETIKIHLIRDNQSTEILMNAIPTHEGYFTLSIPAMSDTQVGIVFGQHYQWLQIDDIRLNNMFHQIENFGQNFIYHEMTQKAPALFECLFQTSLLLIKPLAGCDGSQSYDVIFRPIVRRN